MNIRTITHIVLVSTTAWQMLYESLFIHRLPAAAAAMPGTWLHGDVLLPPSGTTRSDKAGHGRGMLRYEYFLLSMLAGLVGVLLRTRHPMATRARAVTIQSCVPTVVLVRCHQVIA